MSYTLYKHQEDFCNFIKDKKNYLLAWEQGSGKSAALITIIRNIYNEQKIAMPTLIVCPNIVTENWKREIGKFASDKMYQATVILSGTKEQRLKKLSNPKYCIFIINYEGLKVIRDELIKRQWGIFIADEIHKCKNIQAVQSKICVELSKIAIHRYGATGTPILNTMLDIFNLFMILDHGETFGKNFYSFRGRFFTDKNAGFRHKQWYFPAWEPRANAIEELNKLIFTKTSRILKKDCLDLPEKIFQNIYVELTSEQTLHYKNIHEELITEYKDGVITAGNALTKIQRLNQITSGLLFDTEQNVSEISSSKIKALCDILDDLDGKVIIFGVYRKELERIYNICQEKKLGPVLIYGGVNNKQELLDKFENDANCKVVVCNIASAIGFNATAAKYGIYFNKTYSLEHFLQSQDRIHRPGAERHDKIVYINILAKDTIDEVIDNAINGKEDMANAVMNYIKGDVNNDSRVL